MALYFIASECANAKSSGTISRDSIISTPDEYNECIDDYKKHMVSEYGYEYGKIIITQFNRIA